MQDLMSIMLQRQMQQPQTPQPSGVQLAGLMQKPAPVPAVPPNPKPSVPSQTQRWINGQQIQEAYRNNWTPNPVLLSVVK